MDDQFVMDDKVNAKRIKLEPKVHGGSHSGENDNIDNYPELENRIIAYLAYQLSLNEGNRNFFLSQLCDSKHDESFFEHIKESRYAVLDFICDLYSRKGCADLCGEVNKALESGDLRGLIIDAERIQEMTDILCKEESSKETPLEGKIFQTLSSRLEDKWRIIAHFLVKYSVVKKIENEEPRSKLRRVFKEWTQATPKEINRWNRLKNVLNVLEEKVEIEKIENEFGLGNDNKKMLDSISHIEATASGDLLKLRHDLANHYIKLFKHWEIAERIGSRHEKSFDRLGFTISLSVCSSEDFRGRLRKREKNGKQNAYPSASMFKRSIKGSSLFDNPDKSYFLLSGTGGCGKTTFAMYCALSWSEKKLWWDKQTIPYFDFVLLIKCREFYDSGVSDFEALLRSRFPCEFDGIDFVVFKGKRILLILDGIDEAICFSDILVKSCKTSLGRTLRNFLLENWGRNVKTLVTARPQACSQLFQLLKSNHVSKEDIECVEVLGLNEDDIAKYIGNIYNDEPLKRENIQNMIQESTHLRNMVTLPINLATLCLICDSDEVSRIHSSGELLCWGLCYYLKNHFRIETNKAQKWIVNILKSDEVRSVLNDVFTVAYKALEQGKVCLEQPATKDILTTLEKCGLVSFFKNTEMSHSYEFRHLSYQEFCAAVHIIKHNIERSKVFENPHLCGCIGLLSFLEGAILRKNKHAAATPERADIVEIFVNSFDLGLKESECTILEYMCKKWLDSNSIVIRNVELNIAEKQKYEAFFRSLLLCAYEFSISEINFLGSLHRQSIKINFTFSHMELIYLTSLLNSFLSANWPVEEVRIKTQDSKISEEELGNEAEYLNKVDHVWLENFKNLRPDVLRRLNTGFTSSTAKLKGLSLINCNIGVKHLKFMASRLQELTHLDLSRNGKIGITGWNEIGKLGNLKVLVIRKVNLDPKKLEKLERLFGSLDTLDLRENPKLNNKWKEIKQNYPLLSLGGD